MIEQMKKLSLVVLEKESKRLISSLQNFSALHLDESYLSRSIDENKIKTKFLDKAKNVITDLEQRVSHNGNFISKFSTEEIVESHHDLLNEYESCESNLMNYEESIDLYKRWGGFNDALKQQMVQSGWFIGYLEISKKEMKNYSFDEFYYEIIEELNDSNRVVCMFRPNQPIPDFSWIKFPDTSENELNRLRCITKAKLNLLNDQLNCHTQYLDQIKQLWLRLKNEEECIQLNNKLTQGKGGKWKLLIGYYPECEEKQLVRVLKSYNVWFELTEVDEADKVPVKLKNDIYSRSFEYITRIFSLPSYNEFDPTPFFAPFFTLFFGLCLGDTGYGLMILILVLFFKNNLRKKSKPIYYMLVIFSWTTILNGIFLDSFMGAKLILENDKGWAPLPLWLATLSKNENVASLNFPALPFAIIIGFLQLGFGLLLKSIYNFRNQGYFYIFLPSSYLMILFCSLSSLAKINFLELGGFQLFQLDIGAMLSDISNNIIYTLFILSIILIIVFANPKKGIFPLYGCLGLWSIYQFFTGMIGDVLSYLRLFALGLAGGLLGAAINQIAFMTITNKHGDVNYFNINMIAFIIILVIGHLMNFALAALGAFVHPLRLTFVEFYKSIEFQGGGIPYKPLSLHLPESLTKE